MIDRNSLFDGSDLFWNGDFGFLNDSVSVGVLDPDHIYDMSSLLVNDFIILYLEYSY